MRRLKLVAQIILFLSIVSFTFAAVAQTPTMDAMHGNLVTRATDVTESTRTERGYTQSEELPKWLERPSTAGHLHSRFDVQLVKWSRQFSNEGLSAALKDPESEKFFSEELKRKMKEYLVLGSIAGLITGLANGAQKEIFGTISPGAQTIGRSVEPLNEHPKDQEDPVSRSLSNMGDEDLRMLSILSRRMLNRHAAYADCH